MTKKKEIIMVGTFHFEQDEELIRNKHKEVLELVDFLSEYNPTKIALEWEKKNDLELNEAYQKSNEIHAMDEIQQIGFRLAKKLEHQNVFAINWAGHIIEDDLLHLNNTIQNSYPELLNIINLYNEKAIEINANTKLISTYQKLNDKQTVAELEKMYLSFVIADDNNTKERIGINFLNKWMERELMIFKNIIEISDRPDERILLLIGGDHLWMLNKLFEGKGWSVINPFQNINTSINSSEKTIQL